MPWNNGGPGPWGNRQAHPGRRQQEAESGSLGQQGANKGEQDRSPA